MFKFEPPEITPRASVGWLVNVAAALTLAFMFQLALRETRGVVTLWTLLYFLLSVFALLANGFALTFWFRAGGGPRHGQESIQGNDARYEKAGSG